MTLVLIEENVAGNGLGLRSRDELAEPRYYMPWSLDILLEALPLNLYNVHVQAELPEGACSAKLKTLQLFSREAWLAFAVF